MPLVQLLKQTVDIIESLTRMRPLMGFEMRALGIDLLAPGKLAFVYPALRIGWTVLVAPRVMPVGYGGCRSSGSSLCVLRTSDRRKTIRRNGDQSAKNVIYFSFHWRQ